MAFVMLFSIFKQKTNKGLRQDEKSGKKEGAAAHDTS